MVRLVFSGNETEGGGRVRSRELFDYGAGRGNRTPTELAPLRILSPLRLPISPSRLGIILAYERWVAGYGLKAIFPRARFGKAEAVPRYGAKSFGRSGYCCAKQDDRDFFVRGKSFMRGLMRRSGASGRRRRRSVRAVCRAGCGIRRSQGRHDGGKDSAADLHLARCLLRSHIRS